MKLWQINSSKNVPVSVVGSTMVVIILLPLRMIGTSVETSSTMVVTYVLDWTTVDHVGVAVTK